MFLGLPDDWWRTGFNGLWVARELAVHVWFWVVSHYTEHYIEHYTEHYTSLYTSLDTSLSTTLNTKLNTSLDTTLYITAKYFSATSLYISSQGWARRMEGAPSRPCHTGMCLPSSTGVQCVLYNMCSRYGTRCAVCIVQDVQCII